jgi:ABC-type amino acid transport substrate-binding protein
VSGLEVVERRGRFRDKDNSGSRQCRPAPATRERPDLAVAMQMPTHERLGIAYAPERADLCDAVDAAIDALRENGEFAKLQATWPGTDAAS